mmetsp:Transcript_32238/g.63983  ORF Transcript_32238/g.63983 Transcript_32238/m.63983 type:complete len:87 (-) Transcript_32238:144-404(-)
MALIKSVMTPFCARISTSAFGSYPGITWYCSCVRFSRGVRRNDMCRLGDGEDFRENGSAPNKQQNGNTSRKTKPDIAWPGKMDLGR